jgi:acyl-CoA thioester hydrolase
MTKTARISCYKGMAQPWFCDVMGHMNIRHFMAMFDESSYQLLFEVFSWTGNPDNNGGQGWADVKHVIEYQAEVHAGDLLEVHGCITKVGNKSIGIRYEMFNSAKDELAATLDCVCVLIDLTGRNAVPLSDEQRDQAGRYLV